VVSLGGQDGAAWIIARLEGRSYPERVRRDSRTALAGVDFDPATGRVEHVGMRGRSSLEPYDEARAERLLASYLGDDRAEWPEAFVDLDPGGYRLLRFEPETVLARDQSSPAPAAGTGASASTPRLTLTLTLTPSSRPTIRARHQPSGPGSADRGVF